jgi:hypothetical protein
MNRERLRRARREIAGLADSRLDWVSFAQATSEVLAGIVPFDRNCWHTVDPGTVLFTGNLNQGIACSGLAGHLRIPGRRRKQMVVPCP